ncbi:uncharacterized protein LOC112575741 [Pomacea canaliculata]|uniref:uncharacterized protein LOC112575741 n=1 Tax=Pomacea canaliculata TaxID=400727 RepID=UPI000D73D3FC|nr:uncharacterized protein LOC112575741 [Pomacea canaliculata]
MVMNITTLPETSRPQFEIIFNSSTSGKIEMKNWRTYEPSPPFVKTSVLLQAPDDHIVVVHFILHRYICWGYDKTRDHVTFRTENNTVTNELCQSPTNVCSALVFHSGWVLIEFFSYEMFSAEVLTITFEFHHISQPPAALSGDRWNCSVSDWPEMWQGVPCIFVFDCYDREAEVGCWQGDGTFRQGIVQVDGRCIGISQADVTQSSWYHESQWCQQRGGQLVSLSTTKMKDRLPALLRRFNLRTISAIGLMTMSHVTLPMYKHNLQWLDETIAHTRNTHFSTGRQYCVFFVAISFGYGHFSFFLLKNDCDMIYSITYRLCQLSDATRQHHHIQLPVISTHQSAYKLSNAAYIRCPANHFTHVFLACDDVSSCWSNKSGATPSCSAQLTPLPPSFKCGGSPVKSVTGQGFPKMMNLHVLDLRQCPLTNFPKAIFQALDRLQSVFADNYKLSMSVSNTSKAVNDITIARRLVTVVMSDFLCWFPVGLTGILASYDVAVAGEVNVAMAIFILPVNSALNPFLYTLNIYLERRRRAREEERQKRLLYLINVSRIVQKVEM